MVQGFVYWKQISSAIWATRHPKQWPCAVKTHFPDQHPSPGRNITYIFFPSKRPQTVWGSGGIMYDNVDDMMMVMRRRRSRRRRRRSRRRRRQLT